MLKATLDRIAKATGKKPVGWLGAGLAETWNTLDYLIDEGVRYIADWTADDLPFRMNVGGKTIMSIPYSLQINDATQFYNQKSHPGGLREGDQGAIRLPVRGKRAAAARHGDRAASVHFGRSLLERRARSCLHVHHVQAGRLACDGIGNHRPFRQAGAR